MTTSARDALGILFILIVVGVIYSMSEKGISFPNFGNGPQLSPSGVETTNNTESMFGSEKPREETKIEKISAPIKNKISITPQAVETTDPQKEYITIRNGGQESINLGGAEIKNKDNIAAKIEPDETGKPVILNPGDIAYIFTGKSTRGANFKVNKCSGYFNQFHSFIPTLSTRCPNIKDLPGTDKFDDVCLEYLPKIKSCQTPTSLPTNLGSNCQQFIQQHANYQGCVSDHKNDRDFDKGEWRIFLNRTTELWVKRNETIKLVAQNGNILSEANY